MTAVWVLAVVARPYEWWRVALVAVSGLAYVVIFTIPLAAEVVHAGSSNVTITSVALGIGLVGAAAIEVIWWVQGSDARRTATAVESSGRVGTWHS